MSHKAHNDFASAAMLRVLVQGMGRLQMQIPTEVGALEQATVALDLKRRVLESALRQGGLSCLPLLGQGVHALRREPTHLALTAGQSAAELLLRWQRLERYIHSRHRIRVLEVGADHARVLHQHRDHGPAPLPAEDLVVCGVLCALLEANGLQQVRAEAAGTVLYPHPQEGAVAQCVQQGQTASWTFAWESKPADAPEANLALSWAQVAPPLWSQLACAVGDRVAQHLPERLSLPAAAAALDLPVRSFQRALAAEQLSYTQLVEEVRYRLAAWHLVHTRLPIAEVGFVCGYADQAHLTRQLHRRMGVAPGRYRELFSMG